MLGWINQSIRAFISDTFGVDKWEEVLAAAGMPINQDWVSSCPYSDKITYDLVVTAAGLLGVQVNDALEAYGLYFVQHVTDQGYTKLLSVLGSNFAEFLQNLNNLHLHLSYCWPDMIAPSFRCEQVTPESLLLHYYSSRPGLWPIVVGVLKGLSTTTFKLELRVELLHSREKGDSDHEVFRLLYPYQEKLRNFGDITAAAQRSIYSMSAVDFFQLHPFHLVLDSNMELLQWGPGLERVVPGLAVGQHVRSHFKIKHPSYIQMQYQQVLLNTNSHFVLQARASMVQLKGQMVPTSITLPGTQSLQPVLVYLASPRIKDLEEMQSSGVFLSDIALHDMTSDYILLAEQRHAEADLKEKYERLTVELKAANEQLARTTAVLEEEKARAEALLYRMSGLIACFPGPGDSNKQHQALTEVAAAAQQQLSGSQGSFGSGGRHSAALDRIEAVRRELARANINSGELNSIQCLDLLGEGTYGKVYKGLWKGSIVAVKTIVLPAAMSGQEKREKMAIMEAAISSALSHPNIMQTYTYDIKPIKDNSRPAEQQLLLIGSTAAGMGDGTSGNTSTMTSSDGSNVHSYEVRLVLEFCDRGSLREALDLGAFKLPDGAVNYPAVLDTAVEIVTAVLHLHTKNVLHSDLKARNIMLKSAGSEGRGVTAKVADFGLAVKMDHMETHLSNAFQGTMTHMAPEIMIKGHISKAADVYALGMVLWELYTSRHVFRGIPRALLGHQITLLNRRPEFPADAPDDYVKLTQQCWDPLPANRPVLETVLEKLQQMRSSIRSKTKPLAAYDIDTHLAAKHSGSRIKTSPAAAAAAAGKTASASPRGRRTSVSAHRGTAPAAAAAAAVAAAAGATSGSGTGGGGGTGGGVVRSQSDVTNQHRQHTAAGAMDMTRQVSAHLPGAVGGDNSPRSPHPQLQSQQRQASLEGSPGRSSSSKLMGQGSGSHATHVDVRECPSELTSPMPSSRPLTSVAEGGQRWDGSSCGHTAEYQQEQEEDDDEGGGMGDRSFYLEHSASTGDGNWQGFGGVHGFGAYGGVLEMQSIDCITEASDSDIHHPGTLRQQAAAAATAAAAKGGAAAGAAAPTAAGSACPYAHQHQQGGGHKR